MSALIFNCLSIDFGTSLFKTLPIFKESTPDDPTYSAGAWRVRGAQALVQVDEKCREN